MVKVYVTMIDYDEDFYDGGHSTSLDEVYDDQNKAQDRIKELAYYEDYMGIKVDEVNPNRIKVFEAKDIYNTYYIVEKEIK